MKAVHLLPVGTVSIPLLENLRVALSKALPVECEISSFHLDPSFAYHPERQQFHSSEIIESMQSLVLPKDWRFLGVADVDLYIPILKYVFGEAQIGGSCAVVSTFRLRQEFYGLERDEPLLLQRLIKESVHELGHTLELRHCEDYRCVMASSHAVEWIDLRETTMCAACRRQAGFEDSREAGGFVQSNHKTNFS